MSQSFDVVILGGGPAGVAAAKILSSAGQRVAVVEDTHLGGTCLNCGCIPTKMLLGAVAPAALLQAQERLRTVKGSSSVDYAALQGRVTRFVKGSSQTLSKALVAQGVTVFMGRGVCVERGTVRVLSEDGETVLCAKHIILATGSRNASYPNLAVDGEAILDSTALLRLAAVPESLIVVGAGAIGLELSDFFNALGTRVTIVEAAAHIAPTEDAAIAKELEKAVVKSGRVCKVGQRAQSLVTHEGEALLTLEDGTTLSAAKALLAVGRTPNTEGLECERLGCQRTSRGFIEVNEMLEAAEGVYAIGDVNGLTLLAHAAEHQGAYVAHRILGQTIQPYAAGVVPSCIYGSMEVMRVGETAKAVQQRGAAAAVSQAPLSLNPIAQATGTTTGFVQVVWEGERIVGIAAVGHGVSHLVTVAQLLVTEQYTPERLSSLMVAHPTLDEIVPMAIRAAKTAV